MPFYECVRHEDRNGNKEGNRKKAPLLKKISTERISIEFIKLLQGVQAGQALEFMKQSAVMEYLPYPLKEKRLMAT